MNKDINIMSYFISQCQVIISNCRRHVDVKTSCGVTSHFNSKQIDSYLRYFQNTLMEILLVCKITLMRKDCQWTTVHKKTNGTNKINKSHHMVYNNNQTILRSEQQMASNNRMWIR